MSYVKIISRRLSLTIEKLISSVQLKANNHIIKDKLHAYIEPDSDDISLSEHTSFVQRKSVQMALYSGHKTRMYTTAEASIEIIFENNSAYVFGLCRSRNSGGQLGSDDAADDSLLWIVQ